MTHSPRHSVSFRLLTQLACFLWASVFFAACASDLDIFPSVATSTSETDADLPNPISLMVDAVSGQLIVSNSNVDIFYDTGSLTLFDVDATDTTAPELTAVQFLEAPNFSGALFYDGAGRLTVPFREESSAEEGRDRLIQYAVNDGSLVQNLEASVAADPYGITADATQIYVVSDDVLGIFDTDLSHVRDIDLTTADTAGLDDADSMFADSVALNADSSLAFVTNRAGRIFVVDLTTHEIRQTISGPTSSRDIIFSAPYLYILDGGTRQVWVMDTGDLPTPTEIPEVVDDSSVMVATIPVGTDPNGMVLDAANNRMYVANTGENSISVLDLTVFQELTRLSLDSADLTGFLRAAEQPFALALGTFNATQYLFVAGYGSNSVAVVHTDLLRVVAVYPNTDNTDDDDDEEE